MQKCMYYFISSGNQHVLSFDRQRQGREMEELKGRTTKLESDNQELKQNNVKLRQIAIKYKTTATAATPTPTTSTDTEDSTATTAPAETPAVCRRLVGRRERRII